MCEKIKYWHAKGWWTAAMVAQAAAKGLITDAQYKAIVEGANNE